MKVLRISPLISPSRKVAALLSQALGTHVTIKSVYPDPDLVRDAIAAGGFEVVVLQGAPPETRDQIEAVCDGLLLLRPVYTEARTSRGERLHSISGFAAA